MPLFSPRRDPIQRERTAQIWVPDHVYSLLPTSPVPEYASGHGRIVLEGNRDLGESIWRQLNYWRGYVAFAARKTEAPVESDDDVKWYYLGGASCFNTWEKR